MPVLVALRRNPEFGPKCRQFREVGKPAKIAIAALEAEEIQHRAQVALATA